MTLSQKNQLTQSLIDIVTEIDPDPAPLTAAARRRVETLLAQGADPCGFAGQPAPPLMHALARRDFALVKLLLQAGADVNARNAAGNTPFLCAIAHRGAVFVEAMLPYNPDTVCRDADGLDAPSTAAFFQRGADMQQLVARAVAQDPRRKIAAVDPSYRGKPLEQKVILRKYRPRGPAG